MKIKICYFVIIILCSTSYSNEKFNLNNCLNSTVTILINDQYVGTGILLNKSDNWFIVSPKHLLYNIDNNLLKTLKIKIPQCDKSTCALKENNTKIFPIPNMDFIIIYNPVLKTIGNSITSLQKLNEHDTPQIILKPIINTEDSTVTKYKSEILKNVHKSNLINITSYRDVYNMSLKNISELDVNGSNSSTNLCDENNPYEVLLRNKLNSNNLEISQLEIEIKKNIDNQELNKSLNNKIELLKNKNKIPKNYFEKKRRNLFYYFIDLIGSQYVNIAQHKTDTIQGDSGSPYISISNNNKDYIYAIHQGHSNLSKNPCSWGILLKNNNLNTFINKINFEKDTKDSEIRGYNYEDFCKKYHNNKLMEILKKANILDSITAYINNKILKSIKDNEAINKVFPEININGINYSAQNILKNFYIAQLSNSKYDISQNNTNLEYIYNKSRSDYTITLKEILKYEKENNTYLITTAWDTLKKNYGIIFKEEKISFKLFEVYSNTDNKIGRHFLYLPNKFKIQANNNNTFVANAHDSINNFTLSITYNDFDKNGEYVALQEYFRFITGGPSKIFPQNWIESNSYIITSNYFNLPKKGLNAFYRYNGSILSQIYIENNSILSSPNSVTGGGQSLLTALSIKTDNSGNVIMTKSLATAYLSLILNNSVPFNSR